MKFLILIFIFWPVFAMSIEEKSDDHNSLRLGIISRQEILSGRNIYNHNYVEYVPKPDPLEAIHNCSQPVEVKVIFGDWCKDSKKHVPAFIKTMEFANNKAIEVVYINVDRKKKEPAELINGLNIESVPTFIVFLNGKEAGRIVETPKVSVENDLADLLSSQTGRSE